MANTDIEIRNAKPQAKARKFSVGVGLYLIISPNNAKQKKSSP